MVRAEAEAIYDSGREACVEFILELAGRVGRHEDRLRRLEEQARQDSRTSSRPPSADLPKTRAQRRAEARAKAKELMRREGERRKPGAQGGHRGAGRDLKPEDQVDEIVDHYPDACGGCGRRFDDEQRRPDGRFGRHQVCELPPIGVIVSEHRTYQLRCRRCRARTSARLPAELGGAVFGPRLQAAVVTLTARHRISRRGICELARDLFGIELSTGAVDAICQRASDALAGPHCQLQDWVLDQGAVHVDETGWRTRGEGRALWTATTPGATFLQIAEHCNREQLKAEIAPIQTELRRLLQDASPKSRRTRWHRRFANNLLKIWPALWTFVTVEGVEPTNNPAQRALRAPVIHRKVSLGTQSKDGERFAERALSAATTCRLQRRSLFTYLSELLIAHNRGDPFPALA